MKNTHCADCTFSEQIVTSGEEYTFLNANGDAVVRKHEQSIYLCRFNPPIAGEWPQVSEEDWCGMGEPNA